MRVLGISVWIYFIWIFVVGILLFFFVTNDPVEGFRDGGSTPSQIWVETYGIPTGSGSTISQWNPINKTTDKLLYQDRLPVGGSLYSLNGKIVLTFSRGGLITLTGGVADISFQSSANAAYIIHNGNMNILNSDGTYGTSPFVPDVSEWSNYYSFRSVTPLDGTVRDGLRRGGAVAGRVLGSGSGSGSGISSGSGSGSGSGISSGISSGSGSGISSGINMNNIDITTCYLQVQNDGNLVFKTNDGIVLYHTNTTIPIDPCENIRYNINYPASQVDCFQIQRVLTEKEALLDSYKLSNNSEDLVSTQNIVCMLKGQDAYLGCAAYRNSHTDPSLSPPATPPVKPPTMIVANLASGENIIYLRTGVNNPTSSTDLTRHVYPGDMLYIGYASEIQGPFIVYSINTETILITKKYVGADIVNMPISVTPVISKNRSTLCSSAKQGSNPLIEFNTNTGQILTQINYAYYVNYNTALGETDYGGTQGFTGLCPPKNPPSSAVPYSHTIISNYINSLCIGKSSCQINLNAINNIIGVSNMRYTFANVMAVSLFYNNYGTLLPSLNPVKMSMTEEDAIVSIYPGEKSITINNSDPSDSIVQNTCDSTTDGNTITLTSGIQPFTAIDFVYYGIGISGTCSTGFNKTTSTDAAMQEKLIAYITSKCIGKTSCSIQVLPSSMGITDPNPGATKTLAISLSVATNTLPIQLEQGDVVFVKPDGCSPFDTQNSDGTCTRVLCKLGEVDKGDGICIPYVCKNYGDINNENGTCTTQTVYHPCQINEDYDSANNTCNSKSTQPIPYSYTRSVKEAPRNYNVVKYGIPGVTYARPLSLVGIQGVPAYTPLNSALETNDIMTKASMYNDIYNAGLYSFARTLAGGISNTSLSNYTHFLNFGRAWTDALVLGEIRGPSAMYYQKNWVDNDGNIVHKLYITDRNGYIIYSEFFNKLIDINREFVDLYALSENVTVYAVNYLSMANKFLSTSQAYVFRTEIETINSVDSQESTYRANVDSAITNYNSYYEAHVADTNPARTTRNYRVYLTSREVTDLISALDVFAKACHARVKAYSIIKDRLHSIYAPLPTQLISYKYNRQFGPFIIDRDPTTNKLTIKKFQENDNTLDSEDRFMYNPVDTSLTYYLNDGARALRAPPPAGGATPTVPADLLGGSLSVRPADTVLGTPPPALGALAAPTNMLVDVIAPQPNTVESIPVGIIPYTTLLSGTSNIPEYYRNALPGNGIQNAKLYKLDYADGNFNGTYKSLVAGESCGPGQLSLDNSITFSLNTESATPSVIINSNSIVTGLRYQVAVSIKSSKNCHMYLEYSPSEYYTMSDDETTSAGNTVFVRLNTSFNRFIWTFIAKTNRLSFRIKNITGSSLQGSSNTILEINKLSVIGNLKAGAFPLSCVYGSEMNEGHRVCKAST
jgi:hypothetical protein